MTQTPERQTWRVQDAVLAGIGTWSTEEIKAEVNGTISDLEKARTLELSARIRSVEERTPESEVALQTRRGEVSHIHKKYIRLLDELEVRGETYP